MSVDEPSDTSKNTKSNGKEKVTNNVISYQRNKSSDTNLLNKLTKALNVEVNKPLLPLKMTLFCWFAGIGSGSLIGGVIMSKYGGRMAYRVMAAICLGASALYASYLSLRRRSTKKELDLRRIEGGKAVNHESDGTFTPQMVF